MAAQMIRSSSLLNFLKRQVIDIENRKDQLVHEVNTNQVTEQSKNNVVIALKGELDMIALIAERYELFDNDEFKLIFNSVESNLLQLYFSVND